MARKDKRHKGKGLSMAFMASWYEGQSLDRKYWELKEHYEETGALMAAGVVPLDMETLKQIDNEMLKVMGRRIAQSKRIATK